jgi:aconitate hydratase
VSNNVSTDEILPAGARVLPFRSNIPEISKFAFHEIDETFYARAIKFQKQGFVVVGGDNYGQGSSREHAAIAPRYLGLRAVLAKSFARIHRLNLINFGILPLQFVSPEEWEKVGQNDVLVIESLREGLLNGSRILVNNKTKHQTYETAPAMNSRQIEIILAGGLINYVSTEKADANHRFR